MVQSGMPLSQELAVILMQALGVEESRLEPYRVLDGASERKPCDHILFGSFVSKLQVFPFGPLGFHCALEAFNRCMRPVKIMERMPYCSDGNVEGRCVDSNLGFQIKLCTFSKSFCKYGCVQ
jgi:hypothetical protein